MNVTIIDERGLPILCDCGQPAATSWTDTLGNARWYCAAHDPAGQPCPLCGGYGKLPSS